MAAILSGGVVIGLELDPSKEILASANLLAIALDPLVLNNLPFKAISVLYDLSNIPAFYGATHLFIYCCAFDPSLMQSLSDVSIFTI